MYSQQKKTSDNKNSYSPAAINSAQCKLTIGAVNDPLETEADAMADRVMRMPDTPLVQRKCAECEEEDERMQRKPITPFIQEKSEQGVASVNDAVSNRIESTHAGGSPLSNSTRSFMESRFGADFSEVKIHSDSESAHINRELNAKALTVGKDIYFNDGAFQPNSDSGKYLLAHELAHTLQQSGTIRRMPKDRFGRPLGFFPTPEQEAYDKETYEIKKAAEATALEKKILASQDYLKLLDDSKAKVLWIIAQAKTKPIGDTKGQRNYYLTKLEIAITTHFNGKETGKAEYGCSPDAEKENRDEVNKALEIEKLWGGAYADVEENIVATGTKAVKRKGEGGKIFTVDVSDPKNIRVKMKAKLNGKPDDVGSIKKLEDAIERAVWSGTKGYYLDIEFVDTTGPDVFEFTVNFCLWANSGNWASGPVTLSHEVHHALGLGDRYDYIESHAANPQMNVPMRLVWFVEQMKKTGGPRDRFSKMAASSNPLLAEDVCAVAFDEGSERKKCIEARKDIDPAGVPSI